jgi:tetratricopeptide (TPR) repeat protein
VLAPQALVSLGNIALSEGRGDDALALYTEVLEKYPTDPARSAAWFNLGKLQLGRDHTDAALDAFWHVIDSGGSPDVASVAYLYIGRLLIDAEQPRRAITPLIRATKWAPGASIRSKSVLCLAAAYLLYGNPKGANEVLMDFRSDVGSEAIEAAFLGSLARYRVTNNPSRRFVEGQSLLSAVDAVQPQEFFGGYGWYLCGGAYEELMLPEMAAGIYQQAFDANERPPYHDALAYRLATCLAESGDAAAARQRLAYMLQHSADDWQRRAGFRLSQLQLESNQLLDAARTAHDLVGRCTEHADEARALQLLGTSYQRLGDHAAAAMCFAGSLPDHPPPAETVQQ